MSKTVSAATIERDHALALGLAAVIRSAGYFEATNDVMRELTAGLAITIQDRMGTAGVLRVGIHSHCVFIGPSRIRSSLATFQRFASFFRLMESKEINVLLFHAGITRGDLAGLAAVLALEGGKGPEEINTRLRDRGVANIDVDLLGAGGGVQAVAPVEAYAAAVQLGDRLRHGSLTTHVDLRQVRNATQLVVDQIMDDPASLVALTTIKETDDQLISHSANVAILSTLVGNRLGLSKARLGELCLAGFLHDAGKLEVQPEVLGKPGPLDPHEWEEMRRHPVIAARALLGGRTLTPATMRSVVVAYEHHLSYDLTGYPASELHKQVTLFGNIVAVADRYDALTTARTYRKFSFSPHEVVSYLLYYAGTSFDPMVTKLFVELMGLFPPGTLLRLDNGDLGVVCEPPPPGRAVDAPRVRLWTGPHKGEVLDVGEQPDGTTVSVSVVLSPDGMGQVPATDLSLFNVVKSVTPEDLESLDDADDGPPAATLADEAPVAAPSAGAATAPASDPEPEAPPATP